MSIFPLARPVVSPSLRRVWAGVMVLLMAIGVAPIAPADLPTSPRLFATQAVFDAGPERRAQIIDTLADGPAAELPVTWTMLTRAEAQLDDSAAVTLRQDGATLHLTAASTHPGRWTAEPYAVPEGHFGPEQPGVTVLRYDTTATPDRPAEIRVTLTPGGDGVGQQSRSRRPGEPGLLR